MSKSSTSDLGRTIVAAVLSIILIHLWYSLVGHPEHNQEIQKEDHEAIAEQVTEVDDNKSDIDGIIGGNDSTSIKQHMYHELADNLRVSIGNDLLQGSINLRGARLDDITLLHYREDLHDENAGSVFLMQPSSSLRGYYAEFGWVSNNNIELPNSGTLWSTDGESLTPGNSVTLSWKNRDAVLFEIVFQMDDGYLLTITQRVYNNSGNGISIKSYTMITRKDAKSETAFGGHQGAIGYLDNVLQEITYSDLRKKKHISFIQENGWCGIGDQYWMTSIIPSQHNIKKVYDLYRRELPIERFRVGISDPGYTVLDHGASTDNKVHFFVGAKNLDIIEKYKSQLQLELFDRTVDFGFFYFITKPIFLLLNYINGMVQNMGISILLLTIFIRLLVYPLTHKGMKSAAKMKQLKPYLDEINEKYKDNPEEQSKAMFSLYKKHGVNPFSGCLPLFFQIPVFIALYKVLSVSIEMRHAPFLFIEDLSAPDPTSILNLFGLMPWEAPDYFSMGILPITTGALLFIQQKVMPTNKQIQDNPAMKLFPLFFTLIAMSLPAGLLIYSIWGTMISITQQLLTNRYGDKSVASKG